MIGTNLYFTILNINKEGKLELELDSLLATLADRTAAPATSLAGLNHLHRDGSKYLICF